MLIFKMEDEVIEICPTSTGASSTPNILNMLTNSGVISITKDTPNIEVPLCSSTPEESYDTFIRLSKDEQMVFGELLKNRGHVAYISNDKLCFPDSVTYDEFISSNQSYDAIVMDRSFTGTDEILARARGFVIARVIVEKASLPSDSFGNPDVTLPTHFGETLKNKGGFTPPNFVIYSKYNVELWIWCASTTVDTHATLLDANSYTTSVQQAKKAQLIALQQSGAPFRFRGDFGVSNTEEDENITFTHTSGTTGEPIKVPHAPESKLLFNVSGIRELNWNGWDVSNPAKKTVVCLSMITVDRVDCNIHYKAYKNAEDMQRSLEEIKPSYLFTYPSIVEDLDLSKIPSLIGIKTRGEVGATCYYAEETGIIALRCPDNPKNYHVMEHIIIEPHPDIYTGIAVTDLTNPYVKRYILDDHVQLLTNSTCSCGRKTEVIGKILGRTRNMLTDIEGDKIFPSFGDYEKMMPRFQIIQVTTTEFEFRKKDRDLDYYEYKTFIDRLRVDLTKLCGSKEIKFEIVSVEEFPRPFERFISYVK
jgi:phenylacetate-coenzyme A ligase PaaK-like adenylate-forming protein